MAGIREVQPSLNRTLPQQRLRVLTIIIRDRDRDRDRDRERDRDLARVYVAVIYVK